MSILVPLALLALLERFARTVLWATLETALSVRLGTGVPTAPLVTQDTTRLPLTALPAPPSTATASPAADPPPASPAPRDSPQRACVLIATLPTILLAETA